MPLRFISALSISFYNRECAGYPRLSNNCVKSVPDVRFKESMVRSSWNNSKGSVDGGRDEI